MPSPWPQSAPTDAERAAYADAAARSYWLDALPPRTARDPLEAAIDADLCIVGGGYTGLWAALHAKHAEPSREVVLLEATRCGAAASGRNGGFVDSSLTHGISNGLSRFPDEISVLERLGAENFDGMRADIERLGIDCEYRLSGEVDVALSAREAEQLGSHEQLLRRFGHEVTLLDGEQMRAQVNSPLYRGGLWHRSGSAILDPGRLADGLRAAAERSGVRIYEFSPVTHLSAAPSGMQVRAQAGLVRASRVLIATGASPPLLAALGRYVAPVYDYALMSEPLSSEQIDSIGWKQHQGLADMANQFHYYRRTGDWRILWGGYDAVYRYGGDVGPHRDQHEPTFAKLSQHFFATFPQLEGLRFTHRWGGAIDTCSRFALFVGTAHGGRVAYAMGYTGLGVCASRFGASTALDVLDGNQTDATRLQMVRRRPMPFPPEPLRSAVIQLTRSRLAAADLDDGRRGLWLRTLDRLGLGFDS